MRAAEFGTQHLDEIAALQSIANWFAPKYKAFMNKNEAARQAGEAEIRKFTNEHMNKFGIHMGRYRQDWPTVTMYVIYQYLRRTMGLNDNEILQIINDVMQESGQKPVNLQAIKNPKSNIKVGSNAQRAQITAEKIIAAASLAQLEKHWDNEAGVRSNAQSDDQPNAEPAQKPNAEPTTKPDEENLIKTPIVKKASDGYDYRLDVSPINSVWIRTDGSGEAKGRIARELSKNILNKNNNDLPKTNNQTNTEPVPSKKIKHPNTMRNNNNSVANIRNNKQKRRIREYADFTGNLYDLIETATGGATASGSIASVASPMGGVISRTPNLFGYIPAEPQPKTKKRRIRRKSAP